MPRASKQSTPPPVVEPIAPKPKRRRTASSSKKTTTHLEKAPPAPAPVPAPVVVAPTREPVRDDLASLRTELAEVRHLVRSLVEELTHVRLDLQGAGQILRDLPRQAEEFREQLAEVTRRVPESGRQLRAVEGEAREARRSLESLGQEAAEAEQRMRHLREEIDQPSTEEPVESRNRLGVTVGPAVVVAEVTLETPAAKAGLVRGDVIQAVQGTPVQNGVDLRDRLQAVNREDVTLHVSRGDRLEDVVVHLETTEQPGAEGNNHLGATVAPGLVIAEVIVGTPAEAAGLARGDVIEAIDDTPVVTGEQLRQVILPRIENAEVTLRVSRRGEIRHVKIRLDGSGPS